VLQVITTFSANDLKPIVFVDTSISEESIFTLRSIPGLEIIKTSTVSSKFKLISFLQTIVWGRNIRLHRLLKRLNIDVVFESAQFFGWRLGFPVIAWIPDFQHKVLPHLFSSSGWWRRELGFRMQILAGRTIMLSSEDARFCCEHYYPSTYGRTHVVRFAILPKCHALEADSRDIENLYNLTTPFFFMPNQFWRHKNHLLVIEALLILRRRNFFPLIVSTGRQSDPRDPNYFREFKDANNSAGLENQFKLLGLIHYEHLEYLMHHSCALINPSLFEGWSTTVEEARAMGVPIILSDIGVHREQMQETGTYFNPNSAASLAAVLENFVPLSSDARNRWVQKGGVEAIERANKCACDFLCLVRRVLEKSSRG
jgi:glycosyltransferase involved in cell wall biosynthesis